MDPIKEFINEREERIASYAEDAPIKNMALDWLNNSMERMYVYNFEWLGRPIIQYPQDIVGLQEIIWKTKPDLIIETGIAHGGSLILSASMLAMLDICEAIENGVTIDPNSSNRKVLGIDIDIRSHNRKKIEEHPMSSRIQMIQGSSIAEDVISQVKDVASDYTKILICLDSNHTHDHVLAELKAYAPLTSIGSYCIVLDTFVEDISQDLHADRPWGEGNSPKTAVWEYLDDVDDQNIVFEIDKTIPDKLLVTCAPDGFLKRLK